MQTALYTVKGVCRHMALIYGVYRKPDPVPDCARSQHCHLPLFLTSTVYGDFLRRGLIFVDARYELTVERNNVSTVIN